MSHAIVIAELDAGHEMRVRHEFRSGALAQVLDVRHAPRGPHVRMRIRCLEDDAEAVLHRLHQCVANGEIGRMCTWVRHERAEGGPST